MHVKESYHWRVEKEVELFCAAYYNASKGWINDTFNSRYIRVMLLVVVKGKTIFSLYVMVIFLLIEIILYFLGREAWDSRAKYPKGWYSCLT